MSPEKKIRLQAKNTLSNNNWAMAVSAVLVLLVIVLAGLYLISGVGLLFTSIFESLDLPEIFAKKTTTENTQSISMIPLPLIILFIPFFMGFMRFFYLITKNTEVRFSELFYYIGRRFFRAIGVFFGVFVRCLWQAAVCFLPTYIGYVLLVQATSEKEKLAFSDKLCYFIIYALFFGGILLFARLCVKFFLSFYLHFEDENLSIRELCTLSRSYMERFKGSVMKLILSLFPWILSCILIIPCLFVLPYVLTCLATSAKWIIALNYQTDIKDE